MSDCLLTERIANSIRIETKSSFMLLGAPGAGKSVYLKSLERGLASCGCNVPCLGPYCIDWCTPLEVTPRILSDIQDYVPTFNLANYEEDIVELWEILQCSVELRNERFVIILDAGNVSSLHLPRFATFLSGIRKLEATTDGMQLHFVIAGLWDSAALEEYYTARHISFPFTTGYNFAHYYGLAEGDTVKMVSDLRKDVKPVYARTLHELVDGHPGACKEVLSCIPDGRVTVDTLLSSVRYVAESGTLANALIDTWKTLPNSALDLIKVLLRKRFTTVEVPPKIRTLLHGYGLIKEVRHHDYRYVRFRSWYIEQTVRSHLKDFGVIDPDIVGLDFRDLVPEIGCINREAYGIVNDIENQVRNFAVISCSSINTTGRHPLDVQIVAGAKSVNFFAKSQTWRNRVASQGLPTEINPLITYLTTRQLAAILDHISLQINSKAWTEIARLLEEVANIRDAVMHNQLIGDRELEMLINLQAKIYAALNVR